MRARLRVAAILLAAILAACGQAAPSAVTGSTPTQSSPSASASTGGAPKARSNAAWAYDAARGKFLLFGGRYTTGNYHEFPQALGDTWTWDGRSWTELSASATAPVARWDAAVAYDPKRSVVVLHGGSAGGDTWTWDGSRWILMGPERTPPATGVRSMTYAGELGGVLLYLWSDPMLAAFQAPVNELWLWDGQNWSKVVVTAGDPPNHTEAYGSIAYNDGNFGRCVFFEHLQGTPATWTYGGGAWSKAPTTTGTTSPFFSMAANAADSSGVLLYGSNGDTWIWDGSRWSPMSPTHSPGARVGEAMAYDWVHKVVLLFGGYTGKAESLQEHNDLWTWNGSDWTKVSGN